MRRPLAPRLVTVADALREADDTVADAAVAAAVRMEIFEMLTRSEGAVIESREARRSVVNNLVLKEKVRRGFECGISAPGAQLAINGGFTISAISFSILEHPVKTAGGLRAL